MNWQDRTLDEWTDRIQAMGLDFEDVALEALRLATWMMEAAMEYPEWGRAFVRLATVNPRPATDSPLHVICEIFPVEMRE